MTYPCHQSRQELAESPWQKKEQLYELIDITWYLDYRTFIPTNFKSYIYVDKLVAIWSFAMLNIGMPISILVKEIITFSPWQNKIRENGRNLLMIIVLLTSLGSSPYMCFLRQNGNAGMPFFVLVYRQGWSYGLTKICEELFNSNLLEPWRLFKWARKIGGNEKSLTNLCEGTSTDEYCCNLYQETIVCSDRYAHPHPWWVE